MHAGIWAAVVAMVIIGCRDDATAPVVPEAAPMRPDQIVGGNIVPRSYTIPPGRAGELRRLFSGSAMSYPVAVVSAQGVQTQFVQLRPAFLGDNRVVINAPAQYHEEIAKLIAGFAASTTPPKSSTYEMTYWVVEAIVGPQTTVEPGLAEIEATLTGLTGLGKRRFRGLDRVATRTLDGTHAAVTGRMLSLTQKLTTAGDKLEIEVDLKIKDKEQPEPLVLETEIELSLDRPIVLGDAALAGSSDGSANLLLYVVRARRVD